jgi:hypothetical protein
MNNPTRLLIAAALLLMCISSSGNAGTSISLAGHWQFALDPKDVGVTEQWFGKSLSDTVSLPGSTDQNKQGAFNDRKPDMQRLSRLYEYTGPAWYERQIDIPKTWKDQRVTLFLERCHWETQVWLDGKPCGMQDSLCTPHVHELGANLAPGPHLIAIRVDNTVKYDVGGWSHSITEETQTNWNGIVGRMELQATPLATISNVQVYPDIKAKTIKVKTLVHSDKKQPIWLALGVYERGSSKLVQKIVLKSSGFTGEKTFETVMSMPNAKLWDEFSPNLYELRAALASKDNGFDTFDTTFGLRDLAVRNKRIEVNGRKIFIRGTLECCIFPRTGYPPTDLAAWLRIFKICKSYGLNSMRFHSWCPPEAAFAAADQMGFLLHVELPLWAFNVGKEPVRDRFEEDELRRIVDTYGNHPSFGMLCMGNELKGDTAWLQKLVLLGKKIDPRHLYTSSTAYSFGENDDYDVGGARGLHGPTTDTDVRESDAKNKVPMITHELAQWAVFPNVAEIPKYDGVLRARNLELLRDNLNTNHLLDQAGAFTQASGKLSLELYKEEIEAMLRTPGHGGFFLLDLHDFPGQGTATVGILDAFWDPKGIIAPSDYRRFCGPTVPLLRMSKRTFTTDEAFTASAEIANYGPKDIANAVGVWSIDDPSGVRIASGTLPVRRLPTGDLTELGTIDVPLAKVQGPPAELTVTLSLKGTQFSNSWHIWVYPANFNTAPPPDVLVTQSSAEAIVALKQGRKVLVLPSGESLVKSRPGSFAPVFWSPVLFKAQANTSMGILCDPAHPALAGFPTDSYTNWQWYDLLEKSRTMVLDNTPASFRPIVQVIDNFTKNCKLGNLLEARIGDGRLMVCSIDIYADLGRRLAARQLRRSILDYMGSQAFEPRQNLTFDELATFLGERKKTYLESIGAVVYADSEDTPNGNVIANIIDGDPDTFWDTQWIGGDPPYPHFIGIDLPKPMQISGFRYLPRQDMSNGWFTDYEFYLSEDGHKWGEPVAKGTFAASATEKVVQFPPRLARYVVLRALNGYAGKPWAAIAELELIFAPSGGK